MSALIDKSRLILFTGGTVPGPGVSAGDLAAEASARVAGQAALEDSKADATALSAETSARVAGQAALEADKADKTALPPMLRGGADVTDGLGVTSLGERFIALDGDGRLALYDVRGNLFDPAAVRADKYLNSSSGNIADNVGWAVSDFIPVTPGQNIWLVSNTQRRAGLAFYSDRQDTGAYIPGSYVAGGSGTGNVSGLTVPVGAAFMVMNVQSNILPQPTQVMLNAGAAALPYQPHGQPVAVPMAVAAAPGEAVSVAAVRQTPRNLLPTDRRYGALLDLRNTAGVAALSAQAELMDRGFEHGVGWTAQNGFARYRHGASLNGKHLFGAFYAWSSNPANLVNSVATGRVFGEYANLSTTAVMEDVRWGIVPLGPRLWLLWQTGQVADPSVVNALVGRSSVPADPATFFGSGFQLFVGDAAFDPEAMINSILLEDKPRRETKDLVDAVVPPEPPLSPSSRLVLAGSGASYIESGRSGRMVRNSLTIWPEQQLSTAPCRVNIGAVALDGFTLRSPSDDSAPDHYAGTTLGANHGYQLGRCTATAHGKAAGDLGSVWASGGVEAVLVQIINANILLMARRGSNSAPAIGAWAHVSGAANTGAITVSAVAAEQWYPPHINRRLDVAVDGSPVSGQEGEFAYAAAVTVSEAVDILAREDIVEHWIANGGALAGNPEGANPILAHSVSHIYDRGAQMAVASQWTVLRPTQMNDVMGLQVQRTGSVSHYVVPGSLPFAYDGETLDYAMGVAADRTLSASDMPNIFFNAARLQAQGEYAHRVLSLFPSHVFATGLLPVGDAAYDVRRSRVSNRALEIRGNTGKLYFRVLDKGTHTAEPGDSYSAVAYRIVMPRSAARLSFYAVRQGDGEAWIFADWLDKAGVDRLPVAAECPDLIGRRFEVIEARGCSVTAGVLAGSLPVLVGAEGTAAALILRVT